MLTRLVIVVPALTLLAALLFFSALSLQSTPLNQYLPLVSQISPTPTVASPSASLKTTPASLVLYINRYRAGHQLAQLESTGSTCTKFTANPKQTYTNSTLQAMCPTCAKAFIARISKFATVESIFSHLMSDPTVAAVLKDQSTSLLCVGEDPSTLHLLFASLRTTTPTQVEPVKQVAIPSPTPTYFTEDDLWNALTIYRTAHKAIPLNRNEKICEYARQRVNEQIAMFATTKPEDYPVPEKYPLDAHAGFKRDAASGYAFEVTGMHKLAENLAYWPDATAAIHIIEWGWDSSTEGHRETQLSNDYTEACITGKDGFYDAIFGR